MILKPLYVCFSGINSWILMLYELSKGKINGYEAQHLILVKGTISQHFCWSRIVELWEFGTVLARFLMDLLNDDFIYTCCFIYKLMVLMHMGFGMLVLTQKWCCEEACCEKSSKWEEKLCLMMDLWNDRSFQLLLMNLTSYILMME